MTSYKSVNEEYKMFTSLGCLLISLLFAVICARIARNQGRSVPLAFAMGFIFSIFAFIGYLIIGDDHVELAARRHHSWNDEVAGSNDLDFAVYEKQSMKLPTKVEVKEATEVMKDKVEDVKDKVALLPGKGVKVLKKATKKAKKKIENKF